MRITNNCYFLTYYETEHKIWARNGKFKWRYMCASSLHCSEAIRKAPNFTDQNTHQLTRCLGSKHEIVRSFSLRWLIRHTDDQPMPKNAFFGLESHGKFIAFVERKSPYHHNERKWGKKQTKQWTMWAFDDWPAHPPQTKYFRSISCCNYKKPHWNIGISTVDLKPTGSVKFVET